MRLHSVYTVAVCVHSFALFHSVYSVATRTWRLVLVEDSVASVLADVTQALLPCSHTECCELSDDAALEVCSPFARMRVCTRFCFVWSSL